MQYQKTKNANELSLPALKTSQTKSKDEMRKKPIENLVDKRTAAAV